MGTFNDVRANLARHMISTKPFNKIFRLLEAVLSNGKKAGIWQEVQKILARPTLPMSSSSVLAAFFTRQCLNHLVRKYRNSNVNTASQSEFNE